METGAAHPNVLRILDANLNRAREALRVMEEYARFVLEDASLSAAAKQARHDLGEIVRSLAPPTRGGATSPPGESLVLSRDIVGDVGRDIGVAGEYQRGTQQDVAAAAGKRLSESLRVLEEYGKILDPNLGAAFEKLRYQGYELERRLAATTTARQRFGNVRLYVLITESLCRGDWFAIAEAALRGGADALQLREKNLSDRALLDRAKRMASLCREHGALFILNDRPDLALACGADGVHVGQDDLDVPTARRIVGPPKIVGVSTHTLDQAEAAIRTAPDYVAVGPMFDSPTKPQAHIAGLDTLRQIRALTALPLVAIGGITPESTPEVLDAAACAICACDAIISQPDVEAAARAFRRVIDGA